jgi:hypothetical protein
MIDSLQGPISWLVGFTGGNKTVTIRQVGNPPTDTAGLPAFSSGVTERDLQNTNVAATDRIVAIDTTGRSITISENDQIIIDTNPLAIKAVMPIQPGDDPLVVRLAVEGV